MKPHVRQRAQAMPEPQGITVLGSTGSIGISTLQVVAMHPQRYRVAALTGNTQVERLLEQCLQFRPELAAMLDLNAAAELGRRLRAAGATTRVAAGTEGILEAALLPGGQIVMAAIVGAAGLMPTLEAVRAGKRVLLANKEPLVMLGPLIIADAARSGAQLLPIDSEHNAIFQCLPPGLDGLGKTTGVQRILLTCSGGPFRATPAAALVAVTPDQACAHPKWSMGRKISVDSATLMNKGLELIEACHLFGVTPDQVEIVIHPQSIVHSLVAYRDGSVLAQLGNPDMRTPIAHALGWPDRIDSGVAPLDLVAIGQLDFEAPDVERFPCLGLAYAVARQGGTAPALLNAANEVAVASFLAGEIRFTAIAPVIEQVLERIPVQDTVSLEVVLAQDTAARRVAREAIVRRGVRSL